MGMICFVVNKWDTTLNVSPPTRYSLTPRPPLPGERGRMGCQCKFLVSFIDQLMNWNQRIFGTLQDDLHAFTGFVLLIESQGGW